MWWDSDGTLPRATHFGARLELTFASSAPGRYNPPVITENTTHGDTNLSALINENANSPRSADGAPVSSTQKVYRELRRQIIAGDIEPGFKLKIEDLKTRLQAGASPIREALSLLTSDQLVERIDQRGFRTAPVSQAHFLEILGLRCKLEELALRASIQHGDKGWRETLLANVTALGAVERSNTEEWERLHQNFHLQLLSACQSPILLRFCSQLYNQNIRYRNLALRSVESRQRKLNQEHQVIVDAALANDADAASALLSEHYTRTGDNLADLLANIGMP